MARVVGPVPPDGTRQPGPGASGFSASGFSSSGFTAVGQVRVGAPVQRPGWFKAVQVTLLLIPLVELAVFFAVAQLIGGWWTLLLVFAFSALGVVLMRRGGVKAGQAMRAAMRTGQMPERHLVDSGLVMLAGLLLFVPGFVTDLIGLLLLLPPVRAVARRVFTSLVGPMPVMPVGATGPTGPAQPQTPQDAGASGSGPTRPRSEPSSAAGDVIEGEIL